MITEDVFLAEHISLHEKRIIKRLNKNSPYYSKLSKEAEIIQNLNFKGIPSLKDIEEDEEYTYLIEEYIPGATLTELMGYSVLAKGDIFNILNQICIIIRYLHKQSPPVYYLDLNPNNIIINADKEVYLIDYGAAMYGDECKENALQFGMRGFAAPEMEKGGKACEKSDIYSVGCLLYYMLTGKPYNGEKIKRLNAKGSLRLYNILKRCLLEDPAKRPGIERLISYLGKSSFKEKEDIVCNVKTIGLFGSTNGVGTTHIAILLADFIARKTGKKTAYVEFNDSGDCEKLKTVRKEISNNPELIPGVSESKYTELLNEGYEVFVIDFGSDAHESFSELLRCDVKCIIGILSDIKSEQFKICLDKISGFLRQDTWHFIFNLSEKEDAMHMELPKEIPMHFLSYERIRKLSEKTEQTFSKLIRRR